MHCKNHYGDSQANHVVNPINQTRTSKIKSAHGPEFCVISHFEIINQATMFMYKTPRVVYFVVLCVVEVIPFVINRSDLFTNIQQVCFQ